MISVPWQTPAVNQNAAFFAESWPHRAENTPADRENRPAAPREQGRAAGRSEEDELTTNGNLHGIFCHKLCRMVPFRVIYSKNISVFTGTADVNIESSFLADFPRYVPVSAEFGCLNLFQQFFSTRANMAVLNRKRFTVQVHSLRGQYVYQLLHFFRGNVCYAG